MKLNVYDGYHTFDEIKPAIEEITKKANELNDRYMDTTVLGQSVQGRDIQFTVLAKDKATVDKYLNETLPAMKQDPATLQEAIQSGNTEFKVPIWINNIHPDEAPGVDAILDLFKALSQDEIVTFKTTGEDGEETSIDFNVDQALEHVFFLINYTQNPDGRYLNTRENANKFDLNRDNSYQTQVETQIVTAQIAKWSPISFLDFHGFVEGFLIEPCTPPHDPNIEYDLVIDNMLELATAFGEAGIANTSYTSYHIPYEENRKKAEDPNYVPKPGSQVTGWDDASPAYTAVYAMHQGALGHTIEIPALNEESSKALFFGGIAAIDYIAKNTKKLFINQLEIYKRGINNVDNRQVDKYLINAKNQEIGRPRGEHENFFPEYYVLPLDKKLQKNQLEAYRMVQYLQRNDVKVEQSTHAVKVGEIEYPAGSYIINMHQVKRSFANLVLYDGINVSDFSALYADIIQNFPDMRGFNSYVVREADVFKNKTTPVATEVEIPATSIAVDADNYVLRNTNNDAIKAVNELLASNKRVLMLTRSGANYEMGDFLISKESLQSVSSKFFLEVEPFNGSASNSGKLLKSAKVSTAGVFPTYVLKELGFNLVDNQADSDVLVNNFNKDLVSSGKPYIGLGRAELESLDKSKLLDGFVFKTTARTHEGLFKSALSQNHVITAPYDSNEYLYTVSGSYITSVPSGANVIATVSNDADYFKAGWWPGNQAIKNQVVAFTYNIGKLNLTYFANEPLHRAHGQKQFRLVANAIYNATASDYAAPYYPSQPSNPVDSVDPVDPGKPVDPETPVAPENPGTPETPGTPVFSDLGPVASWADEAIEALTKKGVLQGVAEGKFAPLKEVTRAEFIAMLVRAFDLLDAGAKVDFTDVEANVWYYGYVATAVEKGLIQGVGGNKFDPNRAITREEMAIMSANVLKAVKGKTATDASAALAKFKDQDSMAAYAKDAIALLTENKVINGMTATTFQPKGIANRAQAAVMINRMLGIE
nr:S-layer homology domain-containing protein [Paenibacillus roseus]